MLYKKNYYFNVFLKKNTLKDNIYLFETSIQNKII